MSAHGDPPYLRIEAGRTGKDMKNYLATGAEFRKRLHFSAPTVVYVIGCNVGTVNAPFTSNDQFLPTSAVHAGAVAFLAPNSANPSASGATPPAAREPASASISGRMPCRRRCRWARRSSKPNGGPIRNGKPNRLNRPREGLG